MPASPRLRRHVSASNGITLRLATIKAGPSSPMVFISWPRNAVAFLPCVYRLGEEKTASMIHLTKYTVSVTYHAGPLPEVAAQYGAAYRAATKGSDRPEYVSRLLKPCTKRPPGPQPPRGRLSSFPEAPAKAGQGPAAA